MILIIDDEKNIRRTLAIVVEGEGFECEAAGSGEEGLMLLSQTSRVPEVVLLDEPYTGLDPHASAVLREQLASLKDGRRTVVLVTHNMIQGLELADLIAIQVQGRFASVTDAASLDLAELEALYHATVEAPA